MADNCLLLAFEHHQGKPFWTLLSRARDTKQLAKAKRFHLIIPLVCTFYRTDFVWNQRSDSPSSRRQAVCSHTVSWEPVSIPLHTCRAEILCANHNFQEDAEDSWKQHHLNGQYKPSSRHECVDKWLIMKPALEIYKVQTVRFGQTCRGTGRGLFLLV